MSEAMLRARAVSVMVRRVVIRAASGLEARRLGDVLQPALEKAFGAAREGAPAARASRSAAERVSQAVREAVAARLGTRS